MPDNPIKSFQPDTTWKPNSFKPSTFTPTTSTPKEPVKFVNTTTANPADFMDKASGPFKGKAAQPTNRFLSDFWSGINKPYDFAKPIIEANANRQPAGPMRDMYKETLGGYFSPLTIGSEALAGVGAMAGINKLRHPTVELPTEANVPEWLSTAAQKDKIGRLPITNPSRLLPEAKGTTFIGGPSGNPLGQVATADAPLEVQANIAGMGVNRPATSGLGEATDLTHYREQQRLAGLKYTEAEQYPGTRYTYKANPAIDTPTQSGDTRLGFSPETDKSMGYPYNIVPNRLRPRAVQSGIADKLPESLKVQIPDASGETSFTSGGPEITSEHSTFPKKTDNYPVNVGEYELPSAVKTPKVAPTEPVGFSKLPIQEEVTPKSSTNEMFTSSPRKANRQALTDWATKTNVASQHGSYAKEDFADLAGKPELIDAYQEGNRDGRLADVNKWFDDIYESEKKAGIEMPKRENYLRQYWNKADSTEVPATQGSSIPTEGKFQQERTFRTYKQGRAAGFTPKYEDIPSIIAARKAESQKAMAAKELYTYLSDTNQLGKSAVIRDPSTWSFKGPHAKELQKLYGNATQDIPKGLKIVKQIASNVKNRVLAGGIPFTPLNIHGYNIARSEFTARGFKGITDFAKGVFKPSADIATIERTTPLVKKAIDYGFKTFTEDIPANELEQWLDKSKVGKGFNWVDKKADEMLADPLFKVRLRAASNLVLEDNYKRLIKAGKSEEEALRTASSIANDFSGAVNKPLRNKTYDALAQIGFLAPDWAETRAKVGWKGLKALVGKEDATYGKALVRGAGLGLAGEVAKQTTGSKNLSKSPSSSTSIPIGTTDSGKQREIPVYGTAVEALRLPQQIIAGLKDGDPAPLMNLVENRLNPLAKKAANLLISHRDDFDRKLYGKTDFGKDIPLKDAAVNILNEIGAPLEPQSVQALVAYLRGKQGGEESAAQALELPVQYRSPTKGKAGSSSLRIKLDTPSLKVNLH